MININTSSGTPHWIYSILGETYPITVVRKKLYADAKRTNIEYEATVKIDDKLHIGWGKTEEEAVKDLDIRLKDIVAMKIIPKGHYCYSVDKNGKQVNCPFWGINHSKEEMRNGYCNHLGKGDWEKEEPWGFLWDQVKECKINLDNDRE